MHRRKMLLALGAATAALSSGVAIGRAQSRPVLKVGLGPQQPTQADTRRVWEPVYKLVCDRVGCDLDLTVANDWGGISVALASEQIDLAQMGPWGYVLAKAKGDAKIINTMLVDGVPTYKALIVARPGLEIKQFPEDAKGLAMQMLDVGSTSGWLVPTYFLKSRGIDPKTYFSRYAEGASAAAAQMATANGQVDLATGWSTHRNTMIRNGQLKPDSNQIVWESDPLPNEVIVVRRGLDDGLAAKLQTVLTDLSADDKKMLPWPYTGFVPGTYEPYRVLEQMGRELGVIKTS